MTHTESLCSCRDQGCKRPRLWLRRFHHRAWICGCGRAWRTQLVGAADGAVWIWEPWGE